MAVDIPVIRTAVERACARNDVLDAGKRRDLGTVITLLCAEGITQGQLSVLTGIPQGRLSEYKTHKRAPKANSTFEAFADGLGMPPAARRALGLDPQPGGPAVSGAAGAGPAGTAGVSMRSVRPVLGSLSRASAVPVLSGLRAIHRGYLEADQQMGSMCITGSVELQMPVIERVCEVTRGADRIETLQFACRFTELGGWLFQDAGDLACAMHWTDRALDYALELGDQRVIAYTALGEVLASARDSDNAVAEAVAGERQGEQDRAPYCTPAYVEMEAGAS